MKQYVFKKKRWKVLFSLFDGVGTFFYRKKPYCVNPKEIQNIFLIRLDHLGDGILMIPLVQELKRRFPGARLNALLSKEVAEVFEGTGLFDRVWTLENHWFSRHKKTIISPQIRLILNEIRKEKFDLAIDSRGDFRNILFMKMAGIRRRIGFGSAGGGFLLTDELAESRGEHEIERSLRLLGVFDYSADLQLPEIKPGNFPSQFQKKGKYVVVHAGAGTPAKRWNEDCWYDVIRY